MNESSFPTFDVPHVPVSCQSQVHIGSSFSLPAPDTNSLCIFSYIAEFVSDTLSSSCLASHRLHETSAADFFPVALLIWIVFQHPVVCSQLFDYSRALHTSLVASPSVCPGTVNAREGPFSSQCSPYSAREGLIPSFTQCTSVPSVGSAATFSRLMHPCWYSCKVRHLLRQSSFPRLMHSQMFSC